MEQKIVELIEKGKYIKSRIGKLVTQFEYPQNDKNTILLGYHSMMVEHHDAIHLLIQHKLYGSAFSLVRSVYELLYRAHWVNLCACDEQIEKLKKGKNVFPIMSELVKQIDLAYNTGQFWQTLKKESWGPMNDFTHTGVRQLSRRYSKDEIIPNYDLEEVVEVLNGTNVAYLMMALFHFSVFEKQSGIEEAGNLILTYDKMKMSS